MDKKWAIIADDLTGSADTGVQFTKKGLRTYVLALFGLKQPETLPEDADTMVLDTESRFDTSHLAYKKAKSAAGFLNESGFENLYKKIDSTFRGNIGAEIEGALKGSGKRTCLLAAALPQAGRSISDGKVRVHDIPLNETEFATDPRTPVESDSVKEILEVQTKLEVALVGIEVVRSGVGRLEKTIRDFIDSGFRIIVVDGKTESDMKMVALASKNLSEDLLYAGSAGFAEHLTDVDAETKSRKMLLVAGSTTETTRKQMNAVIAEFGAKEINPNIDAMLGTESEANDEIKKICSTFRSSGQDLWLLRSAPECDTVEKARRMGEKLGLNNREVSEKIACFLGRATAYLVDDEKIDMVFLTGGDTAIKTFESLHSESFFIKGEAGKGIPWGFIKRAGHEPLMAVTKAGGFGNPKQILDIIGELLKG